MSNWNNIRNTARELRKNQTPEESKLWFYLRNRKLLGKKFLRQHPIVIREGTKPEFYVVDFFCAEKKLIIELDGKIHDFQQEYDKDRTDLLSELGFQVIRFKNEELEDIKSVLERIRGFWD